MGIRVQRHVWISTVLIASSFAGAAVFLSFWLFFSGFLPAGVHPTGAVASLLVTEPSRRSGAPVGLLERASEVDGVRAAYGSRPTSMVVEHEGVRVELGAAYVSRDFFSALGISLSGPGFSFRQPWQRNLGRECVLSAEVARGLFGAADLLGRTVLVNGQACELVALVDGPFAGLRPPRREALWLSWPSMLGLGVPAMAPDDFLEETFRAPEAGVVLGGGRSLQAIEQELQILYAEHYGPDGRLRLRAGEGMEPRERERLRAEMGLLLVAASTLLLVVGCLLTAASVWRAERRRSEWATHMAFGATRERLASAMARRALGLLLISVPLGALFAVLGHRALLAAFDVGLLASVLPAWPSPRAMGWALAALAVIVALGALADLGTMMRLEESAIWRQIQSSRGHLAIEANVLVFVIAVLAFALLFSIGLAAEQRRLSAIDPGYSNPETVVYSFQQPTSIEQAQQYRAPEAVPDAFIADLEALFGEARIALASSAPYRPVLMTWPVAPPPGEADHGALQFRFNTVSSGFFEVLGARFVEGGVFDEAGDDLVLDVVAAQRLLGPPPWAGRSIRLRGATGDSEHRISGVISSLRIRGRSEDPEPYIYRRISSIASAHHVLVHGAAGAVDAAGVARVAEAHGLRAPLRPPASIASERDRDERFPRFRAWLVLSACSLTVLLGALGLSATLATAQQRRLRELALRSALGASAPRLLLLIGQRMALLLPLGMVLGALAFLAVSGTLLAGAPAVAQLSASTWAWALAGLALIAGSAALPTLLRLYRLAPARLLASE